MDAVSRMIRRLVPERLFGPGMTTVLDVMARSVKRAQVFLADSIREAGPSTATETLPDWYAELGLTHDATQPIAVRRTVATQAFRAGEGQSLEALNEVVQVAFPNVRIEPVRFSPARMAGQGQAGRMAAQSYPEWYPEGAPRDGRYPVAYYRVTGEMQDIPALRTLLNLLDRVAPAEMEPVIGGLTILNQAPTAQAGLGMAGFMEAGRE